MVYGWENIINVPVNVAVQGGPTHSLLTHYGQVTLQQVRDHAATYVNAQTRAAQNNILLYTCLAASISPETKAKAMIFHSDYHEGQTPIGAAYLKILIREANVNTRSTVMHIQAKLSALDSYILTINCNITKFNAYVKDLIDSLMARGEQPMTSWQTYSRHTRLYWTKNSSPTSAKRRTNTKKEQRSTQMPSCSLPITSSKLSDR